MTDTLQTIEVHIHETKALRPSMPKTGTWLIWSNELDNNLENLQEQHDQVDNR